jgi:hypothetical protein
MESGPACILLVEPALVGAVINRLPKIISRGAPLALGGATRLSGNLFGNEDEPSKRECLLHLAVTER